jgi:hypothetical protein
MQNRSAGVGTNARQCVAGFSAMKPSKDEERGDSMRMYASLESSGISQPASPLGPVLLTVAVACAGSMAFGYHLGVVNGPLEAIARDLGAGDATLQGMVSLPRNRSCD